MGAQESKNVHDISEQVCHDLNVYGSLTAESVSAVTEVIIRFCQTLTEEDRKGVADNVRQTSAVPVNESGTVLQSVRDSIPGPPASPGSEHLIGDAPKSKRLHKNISSPLHGSRDDSTSHDGSTVSSTDQRARKKQRLGSISVDGELLSNIDKWSNDPASLFQHEALTLASDISGFGLAAYLNQCHQQGVVLQVATRFCAREFYLHRSAWGQNDKHEFINELRTKNHSLTDKMEERYEKWMALGRGYNTLVAKFGAGVLFALPSDKPDRSYERLPVDTDNKNHKTFIQELQSREIKQAAEPFKSVGAAIDTHLARHRPVRNLAKTAQHHGVLVAFTHTLDTLEDRSPLSYIPHSNQLTTQSEPTVGASYGHLPKPHITPVDQAYELHPYSDITPGGSEPDTPGQNVSRQFVAGHPCVNYAHMPGQTGQEPLSSAVMLDAQRMGIYFQCMPELEGSSISDGDGPHYWDISSCGGGGLNVRSLAGVASRVRF